MSVFHSLRSCSKGTCRLILRGPRATRSLHTYSRALKRDHSNFRVLGVALALAIGLTHTSLIYLDAQPSSPVSFRGTCHEELVGINHSALRLSTEDPATSIRFPEQLRIPSRPQLPTCQLLGVGVRKVSFLGVKVYSVAFYADIERPDLKVC